MNKKYTINQLRQVKGIGKKTIQRIIEQFDENEYVSKYNPNIHIGPNSLIHGDMLEVMNGIPDKSIDMILTDLPYGVTKLGWDEVIPVDKMWKQYNRVIKDNGAIVLFGSEPFSTRLRMSNIDNYKYDWVWNKEYGTNFFQIKKQPLKYHENILVFYKKNITFNRQMILSKPENRRNRIKNNKKSVDISIYGKQNTYIGDNENDLLRNPISILSYSNQKKELHRSKRVHPTQKPIELLEYLIKTYTNEGDVVLDSTMGSGSTCVAAKNTNRKYIGIELDEDYFKIAKERVNKC